MNKRSQAAMEFLLTYGWMIVVALTLVAALAYSGVLSPAKLLPERTHFSGQLENLDNAVLDISGHTIEVAFQNNKGVPIYIPKNTQIISDQCTDGKIQSVKDATTHIEIPSTQAIQNEDRFIIIWNCTTTSEKGSKITANIVFDYKNSETGQTLKESGIVEAKWT